MTQTHKNHNLFCNISNKLHIKNPRLEVNQPLSIYHLPTLGKVAVDSEPEGLQLGQKRLFFKGKFVSLSKNPALPFFLGDFSRRPVKSWLNHLKDSHRHAACHVFLTATRRFKRQVHLGTYILFWDSKTRSFCNTQRLYRLSWNRNILYRLYMSTLISYNIFIHYYEYIIGGCRVQESKSHFLRFFFSGPWTSIFFGVAQLHYSFRLSNKLTTTRFLSASVVELVLFKVTRPCSSNDPLCTFILLSSTHLFASKQKTWGQSFMAKQRLYFHHIFCCQGTHQATLDCQDTSAEKLQGDDQHLKNRNGWELQHVEPQPPILEVKKAIIT